MKGNDSHVRADDIARQPSLSGAFALGAMAAGLDLEKEIHIPLGIDAGHWTRMRSGAAGIQWSLIESICNLTGNDAPILWMLYQRGYDLHSLRKRETETETALREANERIAELEHEREIERRAIRELLGRAAA